MKLSFLAGLGILVMALGVLPTDGWPQAAVRPELVPRQVTVKAEGASALANIGHIISELGQRELIHVRPYVNDSSTNILDVLKNKRLVDEIELPLSYELYLCRLNRHVCSINHVNQQAVTAWTFTRAAETVRVEGMSCTPELPSFVLCLPELAVGKYFTSRTIPYDARQHKLGDIVTNQTGGCETLDDRCRAVLRNLNEGKGGEGTPFATNYSGRLRVPVRVQTLTLPVFSLTHYGALTEALDTLIAAPWRIGGKSFEQANIDYTVPSAARAQFHNPQGGWLEPVGGYMDALKAMSYPFTSAADIQDLRPVTVGIWDFRVDEEHCEFVDASGKAIGIPEPMSPRAPTDGTSLAVTTNCGETRGINRQLYDHGTHVAGIIGARINGHGIAGVNPKALLWTYELMSGDRFNNDADPITRVFSQQPRLPVAVNVSLAFPSTHGSRSVLARLVTEFRDEILFVAAAGNDGLLVVGQEECTTIPACWSMIVEQRGQLNGDNIISVIALNKDGSGLLPHPDDPTKFGTNHGPAFDVAAVGEVVSSFHGNYVGDMRGSSVATPYVTGLVSLIHAKLPLTVHPMPRALKERVLFTSDFSATFDPIVRFGRINFGRALGFVRDAIRLKSSACGPGVAPCTPTVNLKKSDDVLSIRDATSESGQVVKDVKIRVVDIRRLVADADVAASRYWVAYVAKPQGLNLLRNARFESGSELVYDLRNEPKVNVNSILDYTACSFLRGCP